ncbi:protein spindle-F [Phymastichus coffea]|uniref:protein spindle-F n=1 Tax=Phymastichus coffea TaxID=108790 RepID=UPI00273A9BC1|nr:protein spindle-F [Phymastichus coffea]
MDQEDKLESVDPHHALKVAYLTMKERCKQLQARLRKVEEENEMMKRTQCERNIATALNVNQQEGSSFLTQQKQFEEFKNQNRQLAFHTYMVSLENRRLWKKLTSLYQRNKCSNPTTKTTESTKLNSYLDVLPALIFSVQKIPGFNDRYEKNCITDNDNDQSLEEIVLTDEKTDFEQQYIDVNKAIDESQINSETNLKNFGFTYPEDLLTNTDSLEQLKDHDMRLTQIKRALLLQQHNLRNTLNNLKKMKKNQTCNKCKNNITKQMCQAGTQFDSNCSEKENGEAQQTSFPCSSLIDNKSTSPDEDNICPLCGLVYKNSISFNLFHEHVVNHFTNEISDDFEIIT